jgi:DNA-binding beta-propeller fold protein YncE
MKNKTEEPEDPKRLNPQIPEEVGRVILKCLEKDRAKRYQTADDVLADLRKIERSILTADDTAPFAAAKRGTLKKRLPLPLVLLILAVSGLGYVFYNQLLSPQRKSPVQKPSLQTLPVAAAPEAQPRQDGDLSIKSNPAGADIYLEDRLEGTTPFERRLKPGFYRLKIKKTPGYEDITETLEVKAGETSFRDYALVPLKLAKAKIDSTPRGAEIHVADKIVGQTPLEFRLDPGPYDVKIKKEPEYKEIADRWDIKKGEIFVRKYILNPAYILEIETVPESADIKIDSEYKGKSPLKIELSKPSCQLTIENGDQWTKIDEPVVLHSGRNPIRRSLLKVKHSLFIKTIPPGAGVSINGIPVGVSPVKKMDLSGDCEIKIEKEGYAFVSDTVKVESDTEKTYELSKIEPKPPEKEPASPARFGYMVLEFERAWFDFGLKPREQFAPTNLAADNSGQIFVTDRVKKSIRLFSTDGQYRKIWATQTLIDGLTVSPYGVAVDKSGSIYVTDVSYHRIVRFDAEGNVSETWRSYSKKEAYPLNLFKNPTGIAVDNSGRVYICDTGNNRILIINAKGEIVQNLGATGKSPAKFLRPTGIAVDNAGAIYVADQGNCRIQIFSSQGIFLREIGKRLGTTELKSPTGVAVDNMGYVYIVDSGNHKIYKINELGLLVAEQGSLGQEAAQFNSPQGIAVDALGYAYIADTNNRRIQKFKIR